jgi:Family of unknown function (DUF5522)
MIPTQHDWIYQLYVKEFASKLLPTDFYYDKEGRRVMTESYHKRRGSCCGNRCKHCPYDYKNVTQDESKI